MSGFTLPHDPHLTDLARVVTPALVIAESGTDRGVDWTIQPEHVRRPAFRVYVAGRYLSTEATRQDADRLVREAIDDLHDDGLVGDTL